MAALAFLMTACSNDIDEPQAQQQPANSDGMITITAKLAPKSEAGTRAVAPGTDSNGKDIIKVKWAVDEHLAILYEVNSTKYEADARISYVDANTGIATITFSVVEGTADNTACTIVYPKSAAKEDHSGVKDAATLLATQDGTLNANLDVRVGAGTIIATTPNLIVTTQPAAQFAIHKFTIQDLSAADKTATKFKVSDASGNVIATVTPGSATGTLYVALPVMAAGTYWFNATIDTKAYVAKATTTTTTTAGTYYQSTVKMATIGDVILEDGTFAARSSTTGTIVAMIAYLGSETGVAGYTHGLALALTDKGQMSWTDATGASGAAAHTPAAPTTTSSWMLPSKDQWNKMIDACKNVLGIQNNYQDLRDGFSGISGASNLRSDYYWSSTEYGSSRAWLFNSVIGYWGDDGKDHVNHVRSCLAF